METKKVKGMKFEDEFSYADVLLIKDDVEKNFDRAQYVLTSVDQEKVKNRDKLVAKNEDRNRLIQKLSKYIDVNFNDDISEKKQKVQIAL